jgi:oxalate decarboxylase/phosphoglucose isomerase-like protein (cupin superfamily)
LSLLGPDQRCNLDGLPLRRVQAHGGRGEIGFARIVERSRPGIGCHFIDYAEVPPGASVGRHRHGPDEEEFYLVLSGRGRMIRDGVEFRVEPGDLVRNAPGGEHELHNDGSEPVRLFVFELVAEP